MSRILGKNQVFPPHTKPRRTLSKDRIKQAREGLFKTTATEERDGLNSAETQGGGCVSTQWARRIVLKRSMWGIGPPDEAICVCSSALIEVRLLPSHGEWGSYLPDDCISKRRLPGL